MTFSIMSVTELKQHITAAGGSYADCVEKSELRVRAAEALEQTRQRLRLQAVAPRKPGHERRVDGNFGDRWMTTRGRHDAIRAIMKDGGFNINTTPCGRKKLCALLFALGESSEPHDADAAALVLSAPGLDVNAAVNDHGATVLWLQCVYGRARNVELLLADNRVDPNKPDSYVSS